MGVIGWGPDSSYMFVHGPGILLNSQPHQKNFKVKLLESYVGAEISMKQHSQSCFQQALS